MPLLSSLKNSVSSKFYFKAFRRIRKLYLAGEAGAVFDLERDTRAEAPAARAGEALVEVQPMADRIPLGEKTAAAALQALAIGQVAVDVTEQEAAERDGAVHQFGSAADLGDVDLTRCH